MSTPKLIRSPAQTIVQSWVTYEKQETRMEWSRGLPDRWIEDCIEQGLAPFLAARGYAVRYTAHDCSRFLRQWAYAHVEQAHRWREKTYINSMVPSPGGHDDFEYFCLKVDTADLTDFMDAWTSTEFFDESPAGYAQRMDFQQFVWQIVDLERSKTHRKWRETQYDEDQEENTYMHSLHEEGSSAYGGDRRTY